MKASLSPSALVAATVLLLAANAGSLAQDLVVQKDNQRREGQITAVSDGKIKIKIGPAETSIALDQAASVTKAAPKAYEDAMAAWQKGDAAQTLSLLKPLVDAFRGLPVPWAESGSALLGDVYIALGQMPEAETAFAAFKKAYPTSTSLSDIGLARLAIEKKDFASAKTRLAPIVAETEKVAMAPAGKSATFGQACYLMGRVHESEGAYPEALRNYLSAVVLFYEDKAIVSQAQARADVLVKDKQVNVP